MIRYLSIIVLAAVVALPLSAERKKIDYGQRSSMQGQMTEMSIERPEMNSSLTEKRFQLKDWHSSFSTLGREKSNMTTNGNTFSGEQLQYDVQDKKLKNSKMARGNRKMVSGGNWNYVKDNVMAANFSGTEITAPAGRQMQQIIDEVSLQEVNRFMFDRNKTDEGITATRAGEGTFDNIPIQFQEQAVERPEGETLDPSVLFRPPVEKE